MNRLLKISTMTLILLLLASSVWAENFPCKNVSFSDDHLGGTDFIGEITNNSGESFDMAVFSLNVYSRDGNLIAVTPIIIPNFATNQTKSFTAYVDKKIPSHIKYLIQFDNGY